jgi:hypothetical protein
VIRGPHPAEAPFGVDAVAQDARSQQHDKQNLTTLNSPKYETSRYSSKQPDFLATGFSQGLSLEKDVMCEKEGDIDHGQ